MAKTRPRKSHVRHLFNVSATLSLPGLLGVVIPAVAQTIPDGANLASVATPTASTSWALGQTAYLYDPARTATSYNLDVPAGSPGLTITGATGGSTITLNDGQSHYGFLTIAHRASLNLNGSVTISGGQKSGGDSGGAIVGNGDITINGSAGSVITLSNNKVTGNGSGGAIFGLGSVTLNGSTIVLSGNSTVTGNGGAIVAFGNPVTVNGNLVANNNTGNDGGAILASGTGLGHVTVNGSVSMDGNVSANTTGQNGGGISAGGDVRLAAVNGQGNVSLTNNATRGGNGGAVHSNGTTTIGNASGTIVMTGNTAAANGGAVNSTGDVVLTGTDITLSGNRAGSVGGAIAAGQNLTVNLTGTTALSAAGNTAADAGGVLYAASGDVTVNGAATLTNNRSANHGGAFAAKTGNVTVTGGVNAQTNQSGGSGGVINALGNVNVATAQNAGDVVLIGNTAAHNGGGLSAGVDIVGLFVPSGNLNIGNASNVVTMTSNRATGNSGGATSSSGTTAITGSTITVNSNGAQLNGGGVFSMQGVQFNGNLYASENIAGASGGAVHASTGDVNAVNTVEMAANKANGGDGGAVNTVAGNVNLGTSSGNVSLTNNTATGNGGAVNTAGNIALGNAAGTVTLTGNSAGANGGATSSTGTTTITGSTIMLNGNTAAQRGGGIFGTQAVQLNGVLTANQNTAGLGGGAIYATMGDIATQGNVGMDRNRTNRGDGGAVNAAAANGNVDFGATSGDVSLTNNAAGGNGGAIHAGGNIAIGNTAGGAVTLTGNSAGGNGGALHAGRDISLTGTTVSGNSATGSGGAIYATGAFTLNATTVDNFSNNSAGAQGGAIWAGGNVTLNATGGDITFGGNTQNTSTAAQANAIYLNNTGGGSTTTFNTPAGRTITFFDPIQSNPANGLVTVNKLDAGTVAFDGSQYPRATDQWSQVYANTTVSAGTFVVANNAVYGNLAADVAQTSPSSFTVASGATLAGGGAGTVRADNFTHNGTLDIAGVRPGTVGNLFTVASNNVSFGAGSRVLFNTVLNDGSVQQSDLLRLTLNGSATTGTAVAIVNNVGGTGAVTVGNGIQLVDVTGNNGTTANAFVLGNRAVAGAYEYRLYHGSLDGSRPDAWYLRSEEDPVPPTPPNPPDPPTPPDPVRPLFRPEVAAYLANQRLAGQMFVHSLHDRLGEPQYVEEQGFNRADDKPRSGWLRAVGKWEGSKSANGVFKTSTDSFLLHGGAELAKWKLFRDDGADRGHLGLMGSYGYASTDANARGNPFTAKGKVEGWSVGAYGTWFQNDEQKLGAYVDTWFQYGWLTNRVEGPFLPTVRYNATGWAISGETGYAVRTRSDWVIEPQGQLIYVGYNEDDITEANGTRVNGADSHGWITRLGVRLHRTYVREEGKSTWQPYLTLNWWHTGVSSSVSFNDLPLGSMYPSNRYEVKIGTNTQFNRRWTGWANVSGSWGAQSFYQYALRVGVKYTW